MQWFFFFMGCLHLPAVTSCQLLALQCLWKIKPLILQSMCRILVFFFFRKHLGNDLSIIPPPAPKNSAWGADGQNKTCNHYRCSAGSVLQRKCWGRWVGKRHGCSGAHCAKLNVHRHQSTRWTILLSPFKTQGANCCCKDHSLWGKTCYLDWKLPILWKLWANKTNAGCVKSLSTSSAEGKAPKKLRALKLFI